MDMENQEKGDMREMNQQRQVMDELQQESDKLGGRKSTKRRGGSKNKRNSRRKRTSKRKRGSRR